MSDRGQGKENSTMRLMEALSAVDEELLERSEKEPEQKEPVPVKMPGRVYGFVLRNKGILAACLCVALLAAGFRVSRLRLDDEAAKTKSAREESPKMGTNLMGITAFPAEEAEATPNLQDTMAEKAEDFHEIQDDAANDVGAGNDVSAGNVEGSVTDERKQQEDYSITESVPEDSLAMGDRAVQLERYLDNYYLPGECDRDSYTVTDDIKGEIYAWSWVDGGYLVSLRLWELPDGEKTGNIHDAGLKLGIELFETESDWKEEFWEPEEDGRVWFGLVDRNGVVLEYCGYLDKEKTILLLTGWEQAE